MSTVNKRLKESVLAGTCEGTVGLSLPFNARLVELSEQTFPLPHGQAHVMFARHRMPAPDYTTREISLSFTQGLPDGSYDLTKEAYQARLIYADYSNPDQPVIYTQNTGVAHLNYDSERRVFSGRVSALVENNDNDNPKTLNISVTFSANRIIETSRRHRLITA